MSQTDPEQVERARRAQAKLVNQYLQHPDVSMIDIGLDPEETPGKQPQNVVLRVHIRRPLARSGLKLPAEVDGIPVRVIISDIRLQ